MSNRRPAQEIDVGLPPNLIAFRNNNDDEYICIDTNLPLDGEERQIVIWDNIDRCISRVLPVRFVDFLLEELSEYVEAK